MGIYVFSKELLIEILTATSANDFGQDIIPDAIDKYRVMSYPFFGLLGRHRDDSFVL